MIARVQAAVKKHQPMPAMYRELVESINAPDVSFKQLSDIVRYDPGMTMNILKVVNSAAFSGAARIDSLQQAFVRLGMQRLFKIIMAQGVSVELAGRLKGYDVEPKMLLKHSIGVALAAEGLAQKLSYPHDLLFTAGLLHDMGKVVLDPFVQEMRPELDARLAGSDTEYDQIERDVIGVDHAQAGAWLMEQWSFPEELVSCVADHHHPGAAGTYKDAALMVHLADTLIYSAGIGDGIDGFRYRVAEGVAGSLGLRARDIEYLASTTLERLNEWDALI